MIRLAAFILILSLLVLICSCSVLGYQKEDYVTFYYCQAEYIYADGDGVIAPEDRDVTGRTDDLEYLLPLYLVGPLDEDLASPFPARTQLISAQMQENTLTITLSETEKALTDSQFSLACACLTMTCLEITNAEQVTIICSDRSITMHRDSFLLYDDITLTQNTTEETQ